MIKDRSLRPPHVNEEPRRVCDCRAHARPRHRSEHRDLQRRQRGAVESAALQRSRPARVDLGKRAAARQVACGAGNFLDWKKQNTVFEDVAAFGGATATLTGDGDPEQLSGTAVTPGYFEVVGVQPALGRAFQPEEYQLRHRSGSYSGPRFMAATLRRRRKHHQPQHHARRQQLDRYRSDASGTLS